MSGRVAVTDSGLLYPLRARPLTPCALPAPGPARHCRGWVGERQASAPAHGPGPSDGGTGDAVGRPEDGDAHSGRDPRAREAGANGRGALGPATPAPNRNRLGPRDRQCTGGASTPPRLRPPRTEPGEGTTVHRRRLARGLAALHTTSVAPLLPYTRPGDRPGREWKLLTTTAVPAPTPRVTAGTGGAPRPFRQPLLNRPSLLPPVPGPWACSDWSRRGGSQGNGL